MEENEVLKKEVEGVVFRCLEMKCMVEKLEVDLMSVRKEFEQEVEYLCEVKDNDFRIL